YMHDVRYQRAEILCDAATHRPLEERDYDARGQLKGHYRFDAWIDDDGAAAPGVIRAVIPHEKDGQDRSLEVMAAFRKVGRGIWLLSRVESRFRGGNDGSTGTVAVISLNAPDSAFEPVRALVDAARGTEMVIETIRNAGEGPASAPVTTSDWMDLPLNASWSDKARASASVGSEASGVPATPTIGIRRAHLSPTPAGATLDLEGLSTAL